ncbi:hypothetical protein [Hymenobacter gummosus]|uniref:hypothetical protein n=1 Tax=Hymenobacter gummosus TaxID=1776032 RepID=UPI0014043E2F|nr:hypothetical protein [Hymenobacter gummosus]
MDANDRPVINASPLTALCVGPANGSRKAGGIDGKTRLKLDTGFSEQGIVLISVANEYVAGKRIISLRLSQRAKTETDKQ